MKTTISNNFTSVIFTEYIFKLYHSIPRTVHLARILNSIKLFFVNFVRSCEYFIFFKCSSRGITNKYISK